MSVKKDDQINIPHLFKCPISLDLFQDPVTLCTGQTYDRSNIEKWLAAGNVTCPVTMQKLHDLSLVPNITLQHLIHHWLCMDNRFNHEHSKAFDPKLSLILLKNNMEAKGTTLTTKLEALRRIRILSEELEGRRSSLIQLGYFPMLLRVLFRKLSLEEGKLSQEDSDIAEQALHCILNLLPFSDIQSLDMLKDASHLASFFILLEQGSAKIKMNLCYLVEAIASSFQTREISLVLGQTQCLWGALIDRLHDNSTDASEAASKAILALCSMKPNRESFIREGGINSLLSYISTPSARPRSSNALATIKLLLESDSAKKVLVNNPNGIQSLVKMVFGGCTDHEGSDSAISSLLVICYESVKVREEAICAGILTQLLLLLQSQCSSRAKSKARMLFKLLRSLENPSKVATV